MAQLEERIPTLSQRFAFGFKSRVFILKRAACNLCRPPFYARPNPVAQPTGKRLAEHKSLLLTEALPTEKILQRGKIHNLRLAAHALNGSVIPAGKTFSFWRQIGRPVARRGYVAGRELRQGCIIPTIGGGLCQLSNALYAAALTAKLEIVERYAHSQIVPGSQAEMGKDATVFWNYVDLRLRPKFNLLIKAELTQTHLIVSFYKEAA